MAIPAYRTGITVADPDCVAIPRINTTGAQFISLGFVSNTANTRITIRVIMLDAAVGGNVVGSTPQVVFTTRPQTAPADFPGQWIAFPPSMNMFPMPVSAPYALVKVDVIGGTASWSIYSSLSLDPIPVTIIPPASVSVVPTPPV